MIASSVALKRDDFDDATKRRRQNVSLGSSAGGGEEMPRKVYGIRDALFRN
jgi:hypothetical protein